MILQLSYMIPMYRISDRKEGYAFLVINHDKEHDVLFTCAMNDGEVCTLNTSEIKFYKNNSISRV